MGPQLVYQYILVVMYFSCTIFPFLLVHFLCPFKVWGFHLPPPLPFFLLIYYCVIISVFFHLFLFLTIPICSMFLFSNFPILYWEITFIIYSFIQFNILIICNRLPNSHVNIFIIFSFIAMYILYVLV